MTSTQSALVGNGRLLISLDGTGSVLGASWPRIDAFNQVRDLRVLAPHATGETSQRFVTDELVETTIGPVAILDEVLDDRDVWIRSIEGETDDVLVYLAPQIDGRADDQTIYFDEANEVLFAYHRRGWIAIAGEVGTVLGWQASVGSAAEDLRVDRELSGERIASRIVHGFLRLQAGSSRTRVVIAFADSRETALADIEFARSAPSPVRPDTAPVRTLTDQSRNVIRLLTSAETGGVLAGPPLQVDIASEPGYAAVWGRDAAWIEFGSLAAGDFDRVRAFLEFAFHVQTPDGLWLHRHHTDYSVGSSWGLHQLDETGILLRLMLCYGVQSDDWDFLAANFDSIIRAADFLVGAIELDGLPLPSVDLWEERESHNTYTVASFIGGINAAALIAERLDLEAARREAWRAAASRLADRAVETFWSDEHGRFLKAVHSQNALQLDDPTRVDLVPTDAVSSHGAGTPLPAYPNWTTGAVEDVDLTADISVLGLAVPFGVLPADDPRIVSTVERLRAHLWTAEVGGWRRYEGDTYGGGNPWPLATLWVASWEAARGETETAESLLAWVASHTGPNDMIAEQVHRATGEPIAALPMAWSHGMVLLTQAAIAGRPVWEVDLPIASRS